MCLPFSCGGGGRGDHGSPAHPSAQQPPGPLPSPPPPPPPQRVYVPSDQEDYGQAYKSPLKEAQAPHQRKGVSASPPLHGPVVAPPSHPKEAADEMRAPPVVQMARRRGGEDDYPAAAAATTTTTPTPAANNFYGGRDHGGDRHAYGGDKHDRRPQGNSWW